MSLTLNTRENAEGIHCTFKDGRPAGKITPRTVAGSVTGWDAHPLHAPQQFFRARAAAEYLVLAWACEDEAIRKAELDCLYEGLTTD